MCTCDTCESHASSSVCGCCPHMSVQVLAYVSDVMEVGSNVDQANFTMEDVESNIVRCPDQDAAQKMIDGERGGGCSSISSDSTSTSSSSSSRNM